MANTPTRRNAPVCSFCNSHGHNCRTCPSGMFSDVLNSAIINANRLIHRIPEIGPIVACQQLYHWLECNDIRYLSIKWNDRTVSSCHTVYNAMSILATRLRLTTSITNPNRIRLLCEYLITTRSRELNEVGNNTLYTRREQEFRNGLAEQTVYPHAMLQETDRQQEEARQFENYTRVRARALEQERVIRERQRQETADRNRERARQTREEVRQSNGRDTLTRLSVSLQGYFDNLRNRVDRIRFIERIRVARDGNPTGFPSAVYTRFILYASLLVDVDYVNTIQPLEYFRQQQPVQTQVYQRPRQAPVIVPVMTTVTKGVITEQDCPVCYENKRSEEMVVYDCKHGLCVSCYESYLSHLHGRRATCAMCRMTLTKVYREETV